MSKRSKSNSIRIIAGKWRGRRLPVLNAPGLRPTTDRVRETLFNWLMHDVGGSKCLDVFSGSGALGIESLSRGAKFVCFIESNTMAAKNIELNLEMLEPDESTRSAKVWNADAFKILRQKSTESFDIVYLDPPFEDNVISDCIELMENNGWLSDAAIVYIEYGKRSLVDMPSHWKVYREGSTSQSKYRLIFREHI